MRMEMIEGSLSHVFSACPSAVIVATVFFGHLLLKNVPKMLHVFIPELSEATRRVRQAPLTAGPVPLAATQGDFGSVSWPCVQHASSIAP